jgi:peroxiredoxin
VNTGSWMERFQANFPGAHRAMLLAILLLISWPLSTKAFGQQDVHATLVPIATRVAAPDFSLVDATGKSVGLSTYKGSVVLLNFWATACGGCVLEIPYFVAMQSELKGEGFTAVGISMDTSYEKLKSADEAWGSVRPFVAQHKMNYPILMGDSSLLTTYKVTALPVTYLVDKSGRTAAVYVGVVSKEDVEANLKTLLSEH